MFNVIHGQSTIIQNISDSLPFRLWFRTKKDANNGAYYMQYIDNLSARISANKRIILEVNFTDLINGINSPILKSSEEWIDSTQLPDNINL